MDAEVAHRVTIMFIRLGIRLKNVPLRIVSGSDIANSKGRKSAGSHQVFGWNLVPHWDWQQVLTKMLKYWRGFRL